MSRSLSLPKASAVGGSSAPGSQEPSSPRTSSSSSSAPSSPSKPLKKSPSTTTTTITSPGMLMAAPAPGSSSTSVDKSLAYDRRASVESRTFRKSQDGTKGMGRSASVPSVFYDPTGRDHADWVFVLQEGGQWRLMYLVLELGKLSFYKSELDKTCQHETSVAAATLQVVCGTLDSGYAFTVTPPSSPVYVFVCDSALGRGVWLDRLGEVSGGSTTYLSVSALLEAMGSVQKSGVGSSEVTVSTESSEGFPPSRAAVKRPPLPGTMATAHVTCVVSGDEESVITLRRRLEEDLPDVVRAFHGGLSLPVGAKASVAVAVDKPEHMSDAARTAIPGTGPGSLLSSTSV